MQSLLPSVFHQINDPLSLGFGGAWGGMLVFDVLIFIMTVFKSFMLRQRCGTGLLALVLRDGESLPLCLLLVC